MYPLREPTVFASILVTTTILVIAYAGFLVWMRERRRADRLEREREEREVKLDLEREKKESARLEMEAHRLYESREIEERRLHEERNREERRLRADEEREERRLAAEELARYESRKLEEEKMASSASGPGSGGYIVVNMSENERPLFHDLLKGFEEYATLKGYHIAFSIDSTFEGKIAFKFTVKDDGFVIAPERIRQDFKEYVDQVTRDIDKLDDLPVITSFEEHQLVVTLLKNRISFLQHNYKLSQNAVSYYENLISAVRSFPALHAPSVIVHTGGNMDSRSYNAVNSQKVLQGDSSNLIDTSINIGGSLNERQERLTAVDNIIDKLNALEAKDESSSKAERSLMKVRDELADEAEPNTSAIRKWLEVAKNSMGSATLGYEVIEAARKLWEMFGV